MTIRPILRAAGLVGLLAPYAVSGQIRASERGSVSQTVDGTTITIDYSRPQARGRDSLFGDLVAWGRVWTGANWATTLEASSDVTIAGQPVPAGTYSVWWKLQPGAWTLILDPEPRRFHIMPPDSSGAQIRAVLPTGPGPRTELLTWTFDDVRPTGMTLRFSWGTTTVAVPIQVEPSQTFTVTRAFADRFVGPWTMQTQGILGNHTRRFDVTFENDRLVARWESAPNPHLAVIWLAPRGAGIFYPVETENGELFDVLVDLVFEFTPVEGRATAFELRGPFDALLATAERSPE